jgi:proline iminopeptidase
LQAIAPYYTSNHPATLSDIFIQRKWLGTYGGVMAYRSDNLADSDLAELSPDYTESEIAHIWDGNKFTERYLLKDLLSTDFSNIRQLQCPLIIFAGRHDYNVNSQVAAEWFAHVSAPSKQFVWFEDSAHMPMTEEPGKFLTSLLQYARPYASK